MRIETANSAPSLKEPDEALTEKLLREGRLLESGLTGFKQAAQDAFSSRELPGTVANLAESAALGIALSRLAPSSGVLGLAARATGIGMTIAFACDLHKNGQAVVSAMRDSWNSNSSFNEDLGTMRNSLGKFAFDFVLSSAGAAIGSKLMPAKAEILDLDRSARRIVDPRENSGTFSDIRVGSGSTGHSGGQTGSKFESKYDRESSSQSFPRLAERFQPIKKDFFGTEVLTISPEFTRSLKADKNFPEQKYPDFSKNKAMMGFLKKQEEITGSSISKANRKAFDTAIDQYDQSFIPPLWNELRDKNRDLTTLDFRNNSRGMDSHKNLYEIKADVPNLRLVRTERGSRVERTILEPKDFDIHEVSIVPVGNTERLVVSGFRDGASALFLYDPSGKMLNEVPLPANGIVHEMRPGQRNSEVVMIYDSPTMAPRTIRLDAQTGKTTVEKPRLDAFDSEDFTTEKVKVTYRDREGNKQTLPMYISRPNDLSPNGTAPTLFNVYGGFNQVEPYMQYRPASAAWLKHGGVLATAVFPGDGGLGEANHALGAGINKENTVLALIAAAEKIKEMGISSPNHMAIAGASNGGMVASAVLNKRPDLFGAAAIDSPVTSIFDIPKINPGSQKHWLKELGDSKRKEQVSWMSRIDVLNNISASRAYPPTIVSIGTKDGIVNAGNGITYASIRQGLHNSETLLDVNFGGGHASTSLAAQYAFLWERVK